MQIKLVEKNAVFVFDKKGVIILTDIIKSGNVLVGELIYDGKNVAILNRDDLGFEDDFDEYAQEIVSKLREKMTPEKFDEFLKESEKFMRSISK